MTAKRLPKHEEKLQITVEGQSFEGTSGETVGEIEAHAWVTHEGRSLDLIKNTTPSYQTISIFNMN